MAFEKLPPEWNDVGVEPPQSKKDTGFQPGEKPPAQWINWLFNKIYLAVKELQEKAVEKVAGKGLSSNDYTTAEKEKLAGIAAGAQVNTVTSVAGRTGAVTLTKIDVGLGNVDNVKQASKTEFDTHQADNVKHVISSERTSWNGKIDKSLATAANDFLVASGAGAWVKKTLVEVKTLLGLKSAAYTESSTYATAAQGTLATNAMPKGGGTMSGELNFADQLATRPYIKDYAEAVTANNAASGTVTLNIETANNFNLTISGATTLIFSNPSASGRACSITVKINMPATLYAITFPASVKWDGDKIPTFSASKTAILTFITFDAGARWYGMVAGTNFTT